MSIIQKIPEILILILPDINLYNSRISVLIITILNIMSSQSIKFCISVFNYIKIYLNFGTT